MRNTSSTAPNSALRSAVASVATGFLALFTAASLTAATLASCSAEPEPNGSYITTVERARGLFNSGSTTQVSLHVDHDKATLEATGDNGSSTVIYGNLDLDNHTFITDAKTYPLEVHKNGNITMTYEGVVLRFTKTN